jgi:hypothetical protein
MYSVYQHWDPLKVCIVGRSYPPEFYSWITIPHVRSLFEKIAIETEEDYQNIIKKLQEFGVEVLRPDLAEEPFVNGKYLAPPMTPRDYTVMVGDVFYENISSNFMKPNYDDIKDPSWADCTSWDDFNQLPDFIKTECKQHFNFGNDQQHRAEYNKILDYLKRTGTVVKSGHSYANGASLARIGKDLYFGTEAYGQDSNKIKSHVDSVFSNTRNHIVNTGGHSDGTYCPVCPGLIISLYDVPSYADTFPGWEVVYLPGQSWAKVWTFLQLKEKNNGKWWIPGFENDQAVIDVVEKWLGHWTGYVEETVFDVNMLIIDPKNVMVFNYNKQVFDALERYGITPHIVPFRHRYFWDGGIHCVTSDLHREGTMQDYFKGQL